jgi:LuxR family quorum-sensing system transcriptional regulator CciR
MGRFRDVQAFVRAANEISSIDDLRALLTGTVKEIGNYPEAWMATVKAREYISDDPVLMACQTSAAGFRWSNVPTLISLSKRQEHILSGAARAGLGDGFTIPVHIPGECAGSCSFAVRVGRSLREAALPMAQYIGCFAFEAARRLVREPTTHTRVRERSVSPGLTSRQLDCVVLVARGKSDGDAAQLLGISAETVHQHIETAKQRFGVATRTQLVVRTLFDNQLAFQDVIHW